jgi:hypothetical protein
MAHIGRYYPVNFRRDFNLNVLNNNRGWADTYRAETATLGQGIGAVINGVTFLCKPQPQAQLDELDWASDFKLLGLFFYKAELIVQIVKHNQFYCQLSYEVSGHGVILVLDGIQQSGPYQPGFGYIGANVLYWSPDWFDFKPPCSTTIIELNWADINNP